MRRLNLNIAAVLSVIFESKKTGKGRLGRGKIFNEDVLLFKPTTFMNLSGTAVQQVVSYFKIKLEDIIVVFDDMALPVGQIRLRKSGSSGGQKGMQNIIELLHTSEIKRIRIGIGEPPYNAVDYVLGKPLKEEIDGKEVFYLPLSKMEDIYNIEFYYNSEKNIASVDSKDRTLKIEFIEE